MSEQKAVENEVGNITFPRGKLLDPAAGWLERVLARLFVRTDIPTRSDSKVVYMRRFHILQLGKAFRLYLHCFYRSDEDPDPHGHPWSFLTLVLKGGYTDEEWKCWWHNQLVSQRTEGDIIQQDYRSVYMRAVTERTKMNAGSIGFRHASHIHRVQLNSMESRTWTLVASGPRRPESWHFYTADGPVLWNEYVGPR